VLVGGDANCNLAGALAARKLRIKVGHIEAGERSYDWRMPEEHNRVMIDHISDYLFATNAKSKKNLTREAVRGRIFITGNPIVDAVRQNMGLAYTGSGILSRLRLEDRGYFVLTAHREENVDDRATLSDILTGMERVCGRFKKEVIFCAHPRTLDRLRSFGLRKRLDRIGRLRTIRGVGYLDFMRLVSSARLVFTDSGGVQQESYILKVPCVTLRDSTEWTETVERRANLLAGTDPGRIERGAADMLGRKITWRADFGDGRCGHRIIGILKRELERKRI
jgi:UDP-N-acetylglucosamine 2-epimerase (non-hydrolysing)